VGRGTLRSILGSYLEANPGEIDFSYSEQGKPALSGRWQNSGIHFNLAHSHDLAAIAVTRVDPIGIDIEHIRSIRDADDLVARFFSRSERELFEKLPTDEKPGAFFRLWTRKEALLKATGEGITRSLNLVEVTFQSGEPARVVAVDGDARKAASWTLKEFLPEAGYAGAVAIQATNVHIRNGKWESPR
jgi:4'-phosphopantetheinyl transferase